MKFTKFQIKMSYTDYIYLKKHRHVMMIRQYYSQYLYLYLYLLYLVKFT